MERSTAAIAALIVIATAACSGDDDTAETATTSAPPDTTAEATTSTNTTSSSTTVTTLPPTTPPPTTSAEQAAEALKAQIAADYEAAFYRRYEMVGAPSLDNLEENAAQVHVPGSPAYHGLIARVQELAQLGDRVVPNDPDLLSATVESVELIGQPPYTEAIVTACEVTNRKQVTPPPENSPNGQQVEVLGTGELFVTRFDEPVQLTDNGWLTYEEPRQGRGFTQGETTCPPQ